MDSTCSNGDCNPFKNFSDVELSLIAIIPKISASLSLLLSIYVATRIIRDSDKRALVYHRIVLVIALHSIPLSLAFFVGTWAEPRYTEKVQWAIGTITTCTVQGFFIMLGINNIEMYFSSLSLYSVIAVHNNFDQQILRRFEALLYFIVTIISSFLSIMPVTEQMLNPSYGPWCMVDAAPLGCEKSADINCKRGIVESNADVESFKRKYTLLPYLILIGLSICFMILLYVMVWNGERVARKTKATNRNSYVARSGIVIRQASIYIVCGHFPAITLIFIRLVQLMIKGQVSFPSVLLSLSLFPLHPFAVLLVYLILQHKISVKLPPKKKNPFSVSAIIHRVHSKSKLEPVKEEKSNNRFRFSIFDGSSPSPEWSEFIIDDDINDNDNDDDQSEAQGKPNLATI